MNYHSTAEPTEESSNEAQRRLTPAMCPVKPNLTDTPQQHNITDNSESLNHFSIDFNV